MPGPAPLFREIHRLRRHARDLQEQLDRIPRQLRTLQARLQKRDDELRATQEAVRKLKVTASDKEKSIKSRQEQMRRYEGQIDQVSSKKEYDALQLEIAHARTECDKLEDEALQALTESDEKAAQLPALEKAVADARNEIARFEEQVRPRRADLEAQLAVALKELAALDEQVPEPLRIQYNRIVASMGADGMAAVTDRTCSACYTEMTSQSYAELQAERFVLCGSCGRILYLPAAAPREEDSDE